jgi:hypothetical protein
VVAARPRARALAWTERTAPIARAAFAPALEGPMPDDAYRPAFAVDPPMVSFDTCEQIELKVRVTNASAQCVAVSPRPDGSGGIALSFHLQDADYQQHQWDNRRFPLPADTRSRASRSRR